VKVTLGSNPPPPGFPGPPGFFNGPPPPPPPRRRRGLSGQTFDSVGCLRRQVRHSNMLKAADRPITRAGCPAWVNFNHSDSHGSACWERGSARDRDVRGVIHDTSGWFSQKRLGETHAGAKIISIQRGKILGAISSVGLRGAHNIFSLAIKVGAHRRSNQDDAGGPIQRGHRISFPML